jgi:hypothetical protein
MSARILDVSTGRRTAIILIGITALIYAILVGIFLSYEKQEEQHKLLYQQAIAKCFDSGGHIGPGDICWHDNPRNKQELMPN